MDIYSEIKDRLTMSEVVRRYGFEPNRSGFLSCPFHSEKTASMKIYDKSFYCFGCGAGGDMIKFVSMLFNIGNSQASIRLNDDFGLRLTDKKSDRSAYLSYARKKAKEKAELEAYRKEYLAKCDEFRTILKIPKPKTPEDGLIYARYQARLEYLDYWFTENEWR